LLSACIYRIGAVGARATAWEKKCADIGGPKSGRFYDLKSKALAAGRVTEREGRFYIAANDNTQEAA
jgi:hypothetical protein